MTRRPPFKKQKARREAGLSVFAVKQSPSGGLQVGGGGLAALRGDVEAHLLALVQGGHARALHGGDMDENVLVAVARLNEAVAFLRVEPLHGTSSQLVFLTTHALVRYSPARPSCGFSHPTFGFSR